MVLFTMKSLRHYQSHRMLATRIKTSRYIAEGQKYKKYTPFKVNLYVTAESNSVELLPKEEKKEGVNI